MSQTAYPVTHAIADRADMRKPTRPHHMDQDCPRHCAEPPSARREESEKIEEVARHARNFRAAGSSDRDQGSCPSALTNSSLSKSHRQNVPIGSSRMES